MAFNKLMWDGNIIEDPAAWAKERNMEFVRVRLITDAKPNPYTGLMTEPKVEEMDIPRCFYDYYCSRESHMELILCLAENSK